VRFAPVIVFSYVLAAARLPITDPAPAATFTHGEDVLVATLGADHGDAYSEATVERVLRGSEKSGPIIIRWTPEGTVEARAGERLIVIGHSVANMFFAAAAYRDSESVRRDFETNLPGVRRDSIQLASFALLLAIPVAQTILYRLSLRDRRYLKINLVLPLVAIADYVFYEIGVPKGVLRFDLLLLLPIAALIALLWVLFAVRLWNRDELRPEPH
jgi:hypothetical protein